MASDLPSTLEQWLAYQTQVYPRAIDLGLDRLNRVLANLEFRRPELPVVTVGGTNGKGSVVATTAAILTAAGYRVGVFTSPHLRDYRERIRLGDRLVDGDALVAVFERIERARGDVGLTFFEYNTLAALLTFDAARLDAWVLEVGMGGRLDAVNVIDPDVAVVVSVGLDHQEYLGDTLEAIGREKAGIFRAGRAAVLGSRAMPPVVAETARAVGARPKRLGEEFEFQRDGGRWRYTGPRWDFADLPSPNLRGVIQVGNAATAMAALEELAPPLAIPRAAVEQGLRTVSVAGRFEVRAPRGAQGPCWILDVAHNPDAARVLADNLRSTPIAGRTIGLCGVLADKDAAGVLAALAGCIDAWWFVSTEGERGRSAAALAALAARADLRPAAPVATADSIGAACDAACDAAGPVDRVVVFGSFHVVGPAIDWLERRDIR